MPTRPDREAHREDIQLQAGESLFVYLAAGTWLAVAAGQLHVAGAPRWLGTQVVSLQTRLAEGEASLLEESGWLTLTATRGSSRLTIRRSATPSRKARLVAWLRRAGGLFISSRAARMA